MTKYHFKLAGLQAHLQLIGTHKRHFRIASWEPERRVEGPIRPSSSFTAHNSVYTELRRAPLLEATADALHVTRALSTTTTFPFLGYVFARAGSEPDLFTRLFPTMKRKNCEWFRSPTNPLGKLHSFRLLSRGQDYMKASPLSGTGH